MKRLCCLGAVLFLVGIGAGQDRPDRTVEKGVEVVLNHLSPYKIKGESGRLRMEKLFSIAMDDEKLLQAGLTDIETFDVDEEGMIYVIQWHAKGNLIYKFDKNGKFLASFCRAGQGPGEIEWGGTVMAARNGELFAKDPSKAKFAVYSREGRYLREVPLPRILGLDRQFEDGSYLVDWQDQLSDPGHLIDHVALGDSKCERLKDIEVVSRPNSLRAEKIVVGESSFISGASKDRIFVGNSRRGYEIDVYDPGGKIMRRIRKEYAPVAIGEDFKKAYLGRFPAGDPQKKKYQFAKNWPPFRYLFADDEGRLFVMTREPGQRPREFRYDIFNAAGAFIGRTSLGNSDAYYPRTACALMGRIYSLNENDAGYKEVAVYKAVWE
jgi:hypothetical protein